ncbi:hypothetical protein SAMN02745225_00426 [Ferrithrix thermotolerans DSM 19514]|jgi:hypothetical protein|uniref:DUF2510 domain-containing protein n=1 Tax=Ferrithrix thermotolerans DSM 19514 TaxID=1121881 RepID=A0A1M4SX56_9ACTN|nr:DUF2510 domain-containing protein [Ferrithrix thermotolerans]SHE36739.1 hypothetical protein SAMN02745225_00426 [Ferrithrix thermotolerans DSM 19514]
MRLRRRSDRSRLPSSPGWYSDGSGSLRYYSRLGWTERTRPIPQYVDLPGFSNLPPYRIKSRPKTKAHLRKGLSITIVLILAASALSQMTAFWSSSTQSNKFVPLITDQNFTQAATTICSKTLPPQPSIALTGAQYSVNTSSFTYLSSPFQGLSPKVLRQAVQHDDELYRQLKIATKQFESLPPYPGSQSAVSSWISAWTDALRSLALYNNALRHRSASTRSDYKTASANLEWINVFAKANTLNSCAVFSTELF